MDLVIPHHVDKNRLDFFLNSYKVIFNSMNESIKSQVMYQSILKTNLDYFKKKHEAKFFLFRPFDFHYFRTFKDSQKTLIDVTVNVNLLHLRKNDFKRQYKDDILDLFMINQNLDSHQSIDDYEIYVLDLLSNLEKNTVSSY
jgi:hypothetical protein